MAIGDLIDKLTNKFTETVFYKKDSELEYQIQAIKNLLEKYPNDERLLKKLKICEYGLQGEKEIEYELKNADIGMYVLHDVNMKYDDLTAQIDYIIITPARFYFIECKNLIGDIIVNNRGEFIREYYLGKKKIREGIYSPITQAKRHTDIFRKIWNSRNTSFINKLQNRNFDEWCSYLVVMANHKNILNIQYAPKEIKNKIVRSDRLVEYLREEVRKKDKDLREKPKDMHENAFGFMRNYNIDIDRDYEKELEEWLLNNPEKEKRNKDDEGKENNSTTKVLEIRKKLLDYRKNKSKGKNIPAYYVFNNDELDKLLVLMPKTKQELASAKILTEVKLKLHGEEIIKIINE